MTRAPSRSIAHPPRSAHHGLNRCLRRWLAHELRQLRPAIHASAARCNAERYRKHFHAFAHACLLLFHGLAGKPSLRQSYEAFGACRGLVVLSGLAAMPDADDDTLGVSFSQFADSNTTRPADFLAGLLPTVIARVRHGSPLPSHALPEDLHVLDSTCLRLSLKLSPWLSSSGPSDVPGARVQVQYQPGWDLPEHVLVTDTRTNDVGGLDQVILDDPIRLAALRDQTLVIDLGYYSHARFARLRTAQVHFVTRRHPQATLVVEADLPVQEGLSGLAAEQRITVHRDQRVRVGSANNRAGAVLLGLRLVTARVEPQPTAARQGAQSVIYQVLTDRWDLDAVEVIQLYLWRWTIELFFRWLKSHIQLPRMLGHSANAVQLTVWLALLVHLLCVLAAHALGQRRRSPTLLARLGWALAHVERSDTDEVHHHAHQLLLPGFDQFVARPP